MKLTYLILMFMQFDAFAELPKFTLLREIGDVAVYSVCDEGNFRGNIALKSNKLISFGREFGADQLDAANSLYSFILKHSVGEIPSEVEAVRVMAEIIRLFSSAFIDQSVFDYFVLHGVKPKGVKIFEVGEGKVKVDPKDAVRIVGENGGDIIRGQDSVIFNRFVIDTATGDSLILSFVMDGRLNRMLDIRCKQL